MMVWLLIVLSNVLGFMLGRMRDKKVARTLCWIVPLLFVPLAYVNLMTAQPAYRMLMLICILFQGMKGVSVVYRYQQVSTLTFFQWLVYSWTWPGMDPLPFGRRDNMQAATSRRYFLQGLLSIGCGVLLLISLSFLLQGNKIPPYYICLLSFPALIMIFHTGIFEVTAAWLQRIGVHVTSLMVSPWKATSLSDFWGKRWNIAFIQMTQTSIFLPLTKRFPLRVAFMLSFLISGIFHEIAISIPVRAGYGMPTLYFIIQGFGILTERKMLPAQPLLRKVWLWGFLVVPFPLLFHRHFMEGILLPLLQSIQSLTTSLSY